MLMADINIPDHAIVSERFITASGPGGQNVNKVATAVQLHVNIFALGLPPLVYSRLRALVLIESSVVTMTHGALTRA